MTPDMRKALKALGRDLSPSLQQATRELTAPAAARPDPGQALYDQAYGRHERHLIDLYGVRPGAAGRPIVLYVHGGGFVAGGKGGANEPFYRNVGAWAAAAGMVGAVLTYRLAPAAPWPAARDDVMAAMAWLREHAREWGGDPGRLWIMGQSAGAAHVSSVVAELTRSGREHEILGAIMSSGIYDLSRDEPSAGNLAYYGADPAQRAERSSIQWLARTRIPCLYTIAELDPALFQEQAALLVQARLAARGEWPRMHYLPGHNHLTPMQILGSAQDDVGPLLRAFLEEHGQH